MKLNKTYQKSIMLTVLGTLFMMVLSTGAAAVFNGCFTEGQVINFCEDYRPAITVSTDFYTLCMSEYRATPEPCFIHAGFNDCNSLSGEDANCVYFGGENGSGGPIGIDQEPPILTMTTPAGTNDSVFDQATVELAFNTNEESDVYYMDLLDGRNREIRICVECMGDETKQIRFDEGRNEIRFIAKDGVGNTAHVDITFYIDSKAPKISKAEPRSGFADGTFYVEFQEDNPVDLSLHYGNPLQEQDVPLEACEEVRTGKYGCTTNVDLSPFDGQDIDYFFRLTDIAESSDDSSISTVSVDTTAPVITDMSYEQDGKNVEVSLTITEANFDGVDYIDTEDDNARVRSLCSRLSSGKCEGRISVADGPHTIVLTAKDEAGNEANDSFSFFADSKEPKFKSTSPSRGFADGNFEAEVDEANPVDMYLNYGNSQVGYRSAHVDPETDCVEGRSALECSASVDLTDYNEQDIEFWFNITDIIDQTAESKKTTVSVDTVAPVMGPLQYELSGRNAEVSTTIDEVNFDSVEYLVTDDPRAKWRSLCSRLSDGVCEGRISLSDGYHIIDFVAYDEAGNSVNDTLSFYSDSKAPKVSRTSPTRGYADGTFTAELDEANPVMSYLNYGNVGTGYRTYMLDLENDCTESSRGLSCSTSVDLVDYHGQEIEYWFNITDVIEQTAESRKTSLDVDAVFPVINSLTHTIDGRRVTFVVNVTEDNFDVIEYIDNSASSPRFRTLCSRLSDGICEKTLTLSAGTHDIDIQVTDEAGNAVGQSVVVVTT